MSSEISPKKFSSLYRFYKTMVTTIDGKDILIANGKNIFDKKKQSIFFLHGSGLDHTCWLALANQLSSLDYNLVIPDFPGHGYSEGQSLQSIEEQSAWLEKLINQLDCKTPIIIGHSQGGLVALNYSLNSKNLQKIILINSSNKIPVHSDLIELAEKNDSKAVDLMIKWAYSGHNKSLTTELVAKKVISSRELSKTLAVDFSSCNNCRINNDDIKKLNLPVLIITSDNDKMIPSTSSAKLHELIAQSSFEIIKDAGHMLILEEFSKVGDLIKPFLTKN